MLPWPTSAADSIQLEDEMKKVKNLDIRNEEAPVATLLQQIGNEKLEKITLTIHQHNIPEVKVALRDIMKELREHDKYPFAYPFFPKDHIIIEIRTPTKKERQINNLEPPKTS